MKVDRIKIVNFKCFKGEFNLELNDGLNILVGDNESGKSTILEAIYLALTGLFNGRYLKRVLIYPTKPFCDWLKNNLSDLAPTSRSKFYVAITRAKLSVGIVYDFDAETKTDGVKKFSYA